MEACLGCCLIKVYSTLAKQSVHVWCDSFSAARFLATHDTQLTSELLSFLQNDTHLNALWHNEAFHDAKAVAY